MGNIRRLLKNTQVYFVGNLLNRMGAFLLLPLYTRYLIPAQYGTLELVLTSVALVKVFLSMNLGHALIRFHREHNKDEQVNTLILILHLWSLFLLAFLIPMSRPLSVFMAGTDQYTPLFRWGFVLLFFEVVSEAPLARLRADERARLFVTLSGIHLLLRVGLNLYTVVVLQINIHGVLIGNIIAVMIFWGLLLAVTLKKGGISLRGDYLPTLLKYSGPLVVAALPGLLIKNVDKIVLGKYTSFEVLGLYAVATRFRMILEGFVIEPFNLGFGPFRFSILSQDDSRTTLATILTYYALFLSFFGLLIILSTHDVIRMISSESFYDAHKIVPGLIAAAWLQGVHYVFQSGILIAKTTKRLPVISASVAFTNLTALYFFVPRWGAQGAVLALILSSLLDVFLTYRFSQQVYPIPFDLIRIAKVLTATGLIYLFSRFVQEFGFLWRFVMNSLLLFVLFPSILILLQFFTEKEIHKIRIGTEMTLRKALERVRRFCHGGLRLKSGD